MWCNPAGNLAADEIALQWVGGSTVGGPERKISALVLGTARPSHLGGSPPAGSMASLWINGGGTQNLIEITVVAGTVIDLVIEQVVNNNDAVIAVTAAVAGATVGQVYVRALDSTATSQLVPSAYKTI